MPYRCECGRNLTDMWTGAGGTLMVECPVHGVHEWGEIDGDDARAVG